MKKKELIEKNKNNLLLWLEEHTTITDSRDMSAMVEVKKEDIIVQHEENNKIWQGKDGRYYTYLGIGSRRILKSSKDLIHLKEVVINYYLEHNLVRSDVSSFEYLYYEACNYAVESNHLKQNSIDRYSCDYRKFFEHTDFVKMRIENITDIDVADFLDYVLNNFRITEKCFCNIKSLLLFVFAYAKQRRHIACLSLSATLHDLRFTNRRFKQNVVKSKTQVFNVVETPVLQEYIERNYRDLRDIGLILILHTGMRVGEISALKWKHVKDDCIEIRLAECKEMRDGHTVYFNDEPKQGHIRDIVLSYEAKRILNWMRELQYEKHIVSEYVVCDILGEQEHCYKFNSALKKFCKELNIIHRSPHKLRKTYGTALKDAKCDIKFIQEQMGHSDIQTTYKCYIFSRQTDDVYIQNANMVSRELKREVSNQ